MTDPRFTPLSDDINDFCFIDTETKARRGTPTALASVVTAGTYAYAENAFVVIITYAIGNGPVRCIAMDSGWREEGFHFSELPDDLRAFWQRVAAGEAWFVATNAGFDRTLLFHGTADFPWMPPEQMIDCMAQATASNLPPSLEGASRAIGRGGKQDDGKLLINLFSKPDAPQPHERPEEWARYKTYAVRDVGETREVFKATRPLPRREWEEYWASEAINDRGFMVDLEFCRRAAAIADANVARSNAQLAKLTGEKIDRVTQAARIASWVYDHLAYAEAREIMVKAYKEGEEDEVVPAKLGIDRPRIEALLAFFDALEDRLGGLTDKEIAICDVLEIRQWDGSSSPGKFDKMLTQTCSDGVLRGSYVFNGAQQTGRYSSKGVQVHNLPNKFIGLESKTPEDELVAIEMINELEV
jgi:DNA polymerase